MSPLEEEIICEFRRVTRLSIEDVFFSLKSKIPKLTESNLYRCLKRNDLNILPKEDRELAKKIKKQKFRDYKIGYVHVDITEIRVEKTKINLFVGIDRVCKYAYVELFEDKTQKTSKKFIENLISDCPFKVHTILTDNGRQFTYPLLADKLKPKNKTHIFDQICEKNNIKHKLTRFRHPWTNGQVEIFNKKIKDHTTRKYHYKLLNV